MGGVFNYVNLHVYHYAGNNPVKLVDPDGETPKYYISLLKGSIATAIRYGKEDWSKNYYWHNNSVKIYSSDNMIVLISPSAKIQLKIEGIEKRINIINNSGKHFEMDADATVNMLYDLFSSEQTKAFFDWVKDYEILKESGLSLIETIIFAAVGSIYDPAQAIGEALAGSTIDDIGAFIESTINIVNTRRIIYKDITITLD